MADPTSVQDWMSLVRQHEIAARALSEDRIASAQGYWHAGTAVEFALKASIMRRERLNGWPSSDARPDLHTHELKALMHAAGISLSPRDPLAASWHVVLQWNRNQGYDPKPMPRKVARSLVEAVFGAKGVVTWIRSTLI